MRRLGTALQPLIGVSAVLLVWGVVSHTVANANLLPSPLAVTHAFVGMLDDELPKDILASLMHLGVGYGLGATCGLGLALLTVWSRWLEAIIDPFVEFLRPIGAIAWIPIAILLFGVGAAVPVFLIFYASLFPIFVSTFEGIRGVDPSLINAALSLGASRRYIMFRVIIPAALPSVLAGARLSLGVAWMSLVAGEIVGGDAGIGWRILWYQEFFQMDRVMAAILIVGMLGLAADSALRAVQRRTLHGSVESSGLL
ncbi:MAG: ABC transporter permease [Pseudomonadota bacterium]|nr:ABC transporter permease [Pseudomonadota bacterium]